jgi:hypothetical protein
MIAALAVVQALFDFELRAFKRASQPRSKNGHRSKL